MVRGRLAGWIFVALALAAGCRCGAGTGTGTGTGTGSGSGSGSESGSESGSAPLVRIVCPASGCPVEKPADAWVDREGELRVAVDAEPSVLCDLVEHDAWSRWIAENLINETLVVEDPRSGAIRPHLAEPALAADGKSLVLRLRAGVVWHDGHAFSADDVVATLAIVRDPASGADAKAGLSPVSRVEKVDALTVRLTLSRPAPFLLADLAHLTIWPAHLLSQTTAKSLAQSPLVRQPVGTGPFRLASWRAGQEIILERNPTYWGRRPALRRLRFVMIGDRNVALLLFRRGELDLLWRLPAGPHADLATDHALDGARLYAWTPRAYYFVVYNLRRGPLADVRVRRAIDLLIDRRRFNAVAFEGKAVLTTGPYVVGGPSYDATVTTPEPQAAEAQRLLAEAKVKQLDLVFLATAGSKTIDQLATQLRGALAPVGINVRIDAVDFAALLARLRAGDFDMSALQWTLAVEQDNYTVFHSSQKSGGQNYGGLADAEVDRLLDEIRRTVDPEARHALDRALHRRLAEVVPYSFLLAAPVETLVGARVRGLAPTTDGFGFADAAVTK